MGEIGVVMCRWRPSWLDTEQAARWRWRALVTAQRQHLNTGQ
ncbi:hypothetical protein [Streptomyces niveus]